MAAELTAPTPHRRRRLSAEVRHILAGALVLAALALLFVLSAGGERGAIGSYTVTARFPSAEGIRLDSAVRLAGVQIGRVTAMDYDSPTQSAVVTLEIDRGVDLPADSIAIVTSAGMLGGRFIRLDPGGDLELLADGDEIEYTQGSIMFEELLAKIIISVEQKRLAQREAEREGTGAPGAPQEPEGAAQ